MISRPFQYADNIYLASRGRDFKKTEDNWNQDMAPMSGYFKTVLSCFHLNHANISREMNITLNGKLPACDSKPIYLRVTLVYALIYKDCLTKIAQKIKSRNGFLKRLVGST